MNRLTVIDFFCGSGGFSEGFRQMGFDVKLGIDYWRPAIETFNYNFGLNCKVKNVLDFKHSFEEIEQLPNTDVIIGSPPCVTFSSSNISGKADKNSGISLTQIFLKVVAIKKWQKNSTLKAWYMENVPNSIKYLASEYTFEDLGLAQWAEINKIGKSEVAIKLTGNHIQVNSADYGSAQRRVRAISGEIIKREKLIIPKTTHSKDEDSLKSCWVSLNNIKRALPKPNNKKNSRRISDPNYPNIKISHNKLTDHFYDTGLYMTEWRQSKYLKVNHPYMGTMSFPENESNPSRTIIATKIGTSRESIIYKSEFKRTGDGEFRTPTVREAACIMGFPITYQFIGSEGTKWRLVGNAVCPSVSRAFAKQLLLEFGFKSSIVPIVEIKSNINGINNLNSYIEKKFKNPPRRTNNSRFRRHPFKDGNMTVTLSNYDIIKNNKPNDKWFTSIQYGTGEGFPIQNVKDGFYRKIQSIILKYEEGQEFIRLINNGFTKKIGTSKELQMYYELQISNDKISEPTELVEEINCILKKIKFRLSEFEQNGDMIFKFKKRIPLKQLFALYAVNKISTTANENKL